MRIVDENMAALSIQSYWKGYKTRSLLREVNEAFNNLCMEIDGSVHTVDQQQDKIFSSHSRNFEFHSKEQQETNLSDVSVIEEISSISGDDIIQMDGDSEEHVVAVTCINPPHEGDLLKERQDIAMELMWVQQAIDSRREYLRFKNNLSATEDTRL